MGESDQHESELNRTQMALAAVERTQMVLAEAGYPDAMVRVSRVRPDRARVRAADVPPHVVWKAYVVTGQEPSCFECWQAKADLRDRGHTEDYVQNAWTCPEMGLGTDDCGMDRPAASGGPT